MAEANAAYAAGDLAALERLARSWDAAPDSVEGDSVVAQLVRAIRRISWIRQRLTTIDAEIEEAKSSELGRLRARLTPLDGGVHGALQRMVYDLELTIASLERELQGLRRSGGARSRP